MSGVTFDHVTKSFGDVTAVDSMTLEILDGEFMVLLGPSGCGKSTALRMIAGLEEITSGLLTIGDRVVNHVAPRDRDIAMVFQSYALYPHMTVRRNIESPLVANRSARVATDERRHRVEEAAEVLGLTPYLDRKPGALSGGQRQRVALARAIVRRPEVFLMDEPLSNLDAKLRTQTRLELVELHRRLGTTIVYVTHDQVEAMTMADRIAIISDGRLQQVGPPQAVYDRPANLFVAGFVGSPPMNTLAGTVTFVGGEPIVTTGHGSLPVASAGSAQEGRDVVVGIRSEHLRVGDGATHLDGVVETVELLGHERHVVVRVGESLVVIRQPTDSPAVAVGASIPLAAEPSGVHLFDPTSTERLN
ncbi:MAG: sn-glycerol-3-phosphate ABC transporter ATP-binding protein UgpC [Actinobacteria bacterium]|nr:sn-glycerol-3-phosphate ABC transporter ATP-binding protein UgpC [Actinomycetota bacterium]